MAASTKSLASLSSSTATDRANRSNAGAVPGRFASHSLPRSDSPENRKMPETRSTMMSGRIPLSVSVKRINRANSEFEEQKKARPGVLYLPVSKKRIPIGIVLQNRKGECSLIGQPLFFGRHLMPV
jgi:hypothetical protein